MENTEVKRGRILGLDISTKTIGIALFEGNGKLLELTHITPTIKPRPETKLEELFKKVDAFERLLTRYIELDIECEKHQKIKFHIGGTDIWTTDNPKPNEIKEKEIKKHRIL